MEWHDDLIAGRMEPGVNEPLLPELLKALSYRSSLELNQALDDTIAWQTIVGRVPLRIAKFIVTTGVELRLRHLKQAAQDTNQTWDFNQIHHKMMAFLQCRQDQLRDAWSRWGGISAS